MTELPGGTGMSKEMLALQEAVPADAMEDQPVVQVAPGKEPQTPGEWVQQNLFSGPWSTALTLVSTAFAALLLYQVISFVFFTADWTILKVNARSYMTGKWPLEKMWTVWLLIYTFAVMAGLSRGIVPLPIDFSRGRIPVLVFVAGFALLVEQYLVDTLLVHALIGAVVAAVAFGIYLGRTMGPRIKKPLTYAWIAAFPVVIILLRLVAGVPPRLWSGFLVNLIVAVVAIFASFPIGVLLALGRRSTLPVVRYFCVGFIEIIRGAPLYTLLIFGVFVLPLMLPPQVGKPPNIILAMIMITVFSSAYVAEIVRGGLQGIGEGQYEAARALGLSVPRIMALVILPQALRSTIPAMISHFISLFKDTSLLATIAIVELLRQARRASAALGFAGKTMEALLPAALLFWVVAFSMARWSQRLEKRLGVGER